MNFKNKLLAFYSLPILVILVASAQLFKTETQTLSRWKGGGFGMYTNINANLNVIVVNGEVLDDSSFRLTGREKVKTKLNFVFYPNPKSVSRFYEALKKPTDTTTIQVYQPKVDVVHHTLTYHLIYEKVFIKD